MWRLVRSGRTWVALTVTAVWLATMVALWIQETGRLGADLRRMGISPEVLLVSWGGYEHWMWIRRQGETIGATHLAIVPTTLGGRLADDEGGQSLRAARDPGYRMQSHTRMEPELLGRRIPLAIRIDVLMNLTFELETCQAAIDLPGYAVGLQAFTEEGSLFYRLRTAPVEDRATTGILAQDPPPATGGMLMASLGRQDLCGRAALPRPLVLEEAIRSIAPQSDRLEAGERWRLRTADALSLHESLDTTLIVEVEGKETLRLGDREIETWKLSERMGDTRATAWYDMTGRLARRETGGGMVLERADYEQVVQRYPGFRLGHVLPELDRAWIREHVDPELSTRIGEVLKSLPGAAPFL